jgi:hypothetical protein
MRRSNQISQATVEATRTPLMDMRAIVVSSTGYFAEKGLATQTTVGFVRAARQGSGS